MFFIYDACFPLMIFAPSNIDRLPCVTCLRHFCTHHTHHIVHLADSLRNILYAEFSINMTPDMRCCMGRILYMHDRTSYIIRGNSEQVDLVYRPQVWLYWPHTNHAGIFTDHFVLVLILTTIWIDLDPIHIQKSEVKRSLIFITFGGS